MHETNSTLPSLPSRSTRWWIIGGFFLATFLVYGASLTNRFVRFDDGLLIYENPAIRAITPSTITTIFTTYDPELYIPLTFASYQIDYLIGGTNATIYHIQSLLWHTLNALLVAWLAFLLAQPNLTANPESTSKRTPVAKVGLGWALLCGLLFALHPLHTEAVAWASGRKDVLSTFFFLGSVIASLYFRAERKRKFYAWSLGAFLLGLLAKVTVMTLPVALLLVDFLERRPWSRAMLLEKIPYFALSVIFGVVAWLGKTGVMGASTLREKILMAPVSIVFSLEKIFAPVGLSVLYPFTGPVALGRGAVLFPTIVLLLLVLLALASLRRTRAIAAGFAFFLIAVSPTLLNFAKGDFLYFASDRYAYLPSIGILLLIVLGLDRIVMRFGWQRSASVLAAALLLVLGGLSASQARTWQDSEALFTQALRLYPEAYVARVNLGNAARTRGKTQEAITGYETALTILRTEGRAGPGRDRSESKILSNLASAEREQGDLPAARKTYEEALRLNPQNVYALLGLGIIAGQSSQTADAEAHYRAAIAADPAFAPAHLNLGALLVSVGRIEEGIAAYRTSLAQNPFFPQAYYNLGVALMKLNRVSEAEDSYREAVRLQPKYSAARLNLGILLYNRRDVDDATKQFEAILAYDPGNSQARSALRQIQGQ